MKQFFKKYYLAAIAAVVVIAALLIAFFSGGNVEQAKKAAQAATETVVQTTVESTIAASTVETTVAVTTQPAATSPTNPSTTVAPTQPATTAATQPATKAQPVTEPKKDKYNTDPVPSGKPAPVEPQEQEIKDEALKCTISISCATILDNMDKLDEEQWELVPSDGWLLKPIKVEFQKGESVFDVLKRVCMDKNIHLEFTYTPLYNSAYIEGIGNLYEFDCGANSGWNYKVNDWFPNYGCSRYEVKDGDVIEWHYTCNLGYDIGGGPVNYFE